MNAVIVRDAYLIPRMDESIDSIWDAKVISSLDESSGYWHILIARKDKDKTALTTHFGTYAFMHMSFGLKNVPEKNLRPIDTILTT